MKIINKIVLSIVTIVSFLPACQVPPSLSDFNYRSASVLPFYTYHRTKYVILSRERWGRDRGTYDDFSGKRDEGELHPVVTAAREFWEEAILGYSLGLDLNETQNFIDISKSKHTLFVIANTTRKGAKNVTYITNFNRYKTQFINNFYAARRRSRHAENKEKDRIALVKWNDLKEAIINQVNSYDPIYVDALVVNPETNEKEMEQITLRPYLAIKLRSFFLDLPYTAGKSRKIRFYS